MRSGRIRFMVVAALCSLVMAACSDGEEPGDVTQTPSEETESETPEPSEPPADATVAVEDSDLGQIVVDAEGRTLYVFLVDEGQRQHVLRRLRGELAAAHRGRRACRRRGHRRASRDIGAGGRVPPGDARRSPSIPLRGG
jgi:hypothetical protein